MQALTTRRTFRRTTLTLFILLSAYILALLLPIDLDMMSAPLPFARVVPRISGIARSFLPAVQKPLVSATAFSRSSTTYFSTTTNKMTHDTLTLKEAIQHRRTIYQLQKKSTISDDKIKEILTLAIKDVPSSFNSQSSRIVALFHDNHDKFWNIVEDKLRPLVDAENWQKTADRVAMFRNAYATILFYEDPAVVKGLQDKMPIYADKFPQWSEHTSAMHQYALWVAFEAEGLGFNLQHYNPLPNEEVSKVWDVPKEWDLKGQLVIGAPAEGARANLQEKEQGPIEKRLIFHGA